MSVEFTQLVIGGADRKDNAIDAFLTRRMNGVGQWEATLHNTAGVYNGVFSVQDQFLIDVDAVTLMQGRLDGPGQRIIGRDVEDIWGEFTAVGGFDQAQDLLFHNDFEKLYPNTAQTLHSVVNDIFNVELAGSTNITYAAVGASPVIGAVEFKEGTSFLATLQEMHRRAGWVFFVQDNLAFRHGAPGFLASGETISSVAGGANNTVLGPEAVVTQISGDKLYNWIKLYGKNPMFDAYTEQNAATWTTTFGGNQPIDVTNPVQVGTYSQRVYNNNPAVLQLAHVLLLPAFNYTAFDFSKGKLGLWGRYDNQAGGIGNPGAGTAWASHRVECRLTDNLGRFVQYYGDDTRIFRGEWGWCEWTLGEEYNGAVGGVANQWFQGGGVSFDWSNVVSVRFHLPRLGVVGNRPSNFYIDGITLPVAPIAIAENVASQTSFRKRPFIDQRPDIRTQNALDERATQILTHHEGESLDMIRVNVVGNSGLLYAGTTVDINIPSFGINTQVFNMTEINHVIAPHVDVTDGYGYDYMTVVEAVPISGVAFDLGRLRPGQIYSASQMSRRDGTGLRVK